MTKKEELNDLINQYDVAYYDYANLKKYQIIAILVFFIGGFILFLVLNNKKKKMLQQKSEALRMLDSISTEITIDEFLECKQRIVMIGNQ